MLSIKISKAESVTRVTQRLKPVWSLCSVMNVTKVRRQFFTLAPFVALIVIGFARAASPAGVRGESGSEILAGCLRTEQLS